MVIAYPMNKADLTYRSFLPFTRHPLNLSSYMHLYAHIGAYLFFLIFPTVAWRVYLLPSLNRPLSLKIACRLQPMTIEVPVHISEVAVERLDMMY